MSQTFAFWDHHPNSPETIAPTSYSPVLPPRKQSPKNSYLELVARTSWKAALGNLKLGVFSWRALCNPVRPRRPPVQCERAQEGFLTGDGRVVYSIPFMLERPPPKSLQLVVLLDADGNSLNDRTRPADRNKRISMVTCNYQSFERAITERFASAEPQNRLRGESRLSRIRPRKWT
jgi:hypothetical protein